jgi:cellulose synthase/poly-beta-1,6-N-acetylglucosamine synthase-like glycosyltransferase
VKFLQSLEHSVQAVQKGLRCKAALPEIFAHYKYFCIVDSDDILPETFLSELVAIAKADETVGFVQAAHIQYGITSFAREIGHGMVPHWNYFLPARNECGFVHFYGHSALLRTSAVRKLGGFPEIVSEDLALSTEMRRLGYRGHYAEHVVCSEETPRSFNCFVRRQRRIVIGTLQYVRLYLWPFLRCQKVDWREKMDLLLAIGYLYLPIAWTAFLITVHSVLLINERQDVASFGSFWRSASVINQGPLALREFKVLVGIVVLSPLIYQIPNIRQQGFSALRRCANLMCLHLAIVMWIVPWCAKWIVSQKVEFVPTGTKEFQRNAKRDVFKPICLGAVLTLLGVLAGNLGTIIVSLCILLGPLLDKLLEHTWGRTLTAIPAVLVVTCFLLTPTLWYVGVVSAIGNDHW